MTPLDHVVGRLAGGGWIGVDLFFVISGFLITGILLDTRDVPGRWRNFFARRVLRIFPLYYGVLVFMFLILPRLWSPAELTQIRAQQVWYWGYAVNFLELLNRGAWQPLSTGHFWSLAIEEQFYLVWPLVVWACSPRTLPRVIVGTLVAGLLIRVWFCIGDPFQTPWSAYLFTPTHLDGLMVGALLAGAVRAPGGVERLVPLARRVMAWGAVALGAIVLWRGGFRAADQVVAIVGFPFMAAVFGALLVLTLPGAQRGVAQRVFEHPGLRWLGTYSYGLYVFHLPVIGALQWKGLSFERRLPGVLLVVALAAVISCAVAWLSYRLYEKHFLALKSYFAVGPGR